MHNEEMNAKSPSKAGLLRRGAGIALAALLLVPQAALSAPLGLCGTQTTDGDPNTSDTIICDPDEGYPDGISYTSDGDLTLEVPSASSFNSALRVNDDGIDVTAGNDVDNLFWDSSLFTGGNIMGAAGAVLDYRSVDGDIEILIGGEIIGIVDATHTIRAESAGAGNVSVTTQDVVNPLPGRRDPAPSGIGIEALTVDGDIDILAGDDVSGGRVGNTPAIRAESTGAGNVNVTTQGVINALGGQFARAVPFGSGIETLTAGGDITIDAAEVNVGEGGQFGIRAVSSAGGDIVIDSGDVQFGFFDFRAPSPQPDAVGIETQTDGVATINLSGSVFREVTSSTFDIAIRSSGNRVVVNAEGTPLAGFPIEGFALTLPGMRGAVDFSALTGGAEVNLGPGTLWALGANRERFNDDEPATVSRFSGADDVVNIDSGAFLSMPIGAESNTSPGITEDLVIVNFDDGVDVVNNAGELLVSPGDTFAESDEPSQLIFYEAELRLEGLETFNNAGTIRLGADVGSARRDGELRSGTDRVADDILALPDATFHAQEGSRILLDADLGAIGKPACDAGQRDTEGSKAGGGTFGDLPADCLNIGGAVTGERTLIDVTDAKPSDRGVYNPDGSVLVDLADSDADIDPEAFVLGPDSDHFNPDLEIMEKGLFFYTIAYDPATRQFKLFGQPASIGQQFPLLAHASNDLWHTATGAWFDRRVDQRDVDLDTGLGGGTWIRAGYRDADRDVITPIVAGGRTIEFDNGYSQEDQSITVGRDFVSRSAGDNAWVLGAMVGYGRAQVDYDVKANGANLEGMHGGLYGSFVTGAFYLDAALNAAQFDIQNNVPALGLTPEGTVLDTEASAYGARIEAGWRWRAGRLAVEPLAGLSYVQTSIDEIEVPADDVIFSAEKVNIDDTVSNRGSLGVRVSMSDLLPGIVPTEVGLTVRGIEEFDGDAEASIASISPFDAPVSDTYDDTFGQVTGDVSITNTAKTAAGYLKVDGTFGDDYDSLGGSIGFRYQW